MARKRRGAPRRSAPMSRPPSSRSGPRPPLNGRGDSDRARPEQLLRPPQPIPATEPSPPADEQRRQSEQRPQSEQPETLLGGRYRLDDLLGEGQASDVYAARDTLLGREVAVKVLRAQGDMVAQRRVLRAAQAVARIQTPLRNVIPVRDVHVGHPTFLVLDLIRGHLLSDVLPARLTEDHARRLADDILTGLTGLHETGEVHRDVTPENVLIDADGGVLITSTGLGEAALDPGLGPRAAEDRPRPHGSAPSPEQELGLAATAPSDVYAAAMIVRELLPKPSAAVRQVLTRATQQEPEQRYAHAGEFQAALREAWPSDVGSWDPDSGLVITPLKPDAPPERRRPGLVAVVAGLALAFVAVMMLRLGEPSSAPAPQPSPPTATADADANLAAAPSPVATISENALDAVIAEAQRDPAAIGVGARTLLPRLEALETLEGEERSAEVAGLYGAFVVGAARGGVDPGFADRVAQALWPEVTVDSLVALIASNPEAAGERGPTFLGALRDLVSIEDDEDRLTRGADLGFVAAEWAQDRTLSPAVAITALTALNGLQGGGAQRTEVVVDVPATQQFTDTGIDVPAGAVVIVVASGEVSSGEASGVGPDGVTTDPELREFNLVSEVNHAALLGRVADDRDPFFVGSEAVFPVAAPGQLFLGVNDEEPANNRGAFQATVTVWGKAG
jgi:eukaryotic-like serine/threonine-protein kinase